MTPTRRRPSPPATPSTYNAIKRPHEDERTDKNSCFTSSQTQTVLPSKGKSVNDLCSSEGSKHTTFTDPIERSAPFGIERSFARAATEGDVSYQTSYEDLLRKLQLSQAQVEEKKKQMALIKEENESLRRENLILEIQLYSSSPTKSTSRVGGGLLSFMSGF